MAAFICCGRSDCSNLPKAEQLAFFKRKRKKFKLGIDFIEKPRYNAYLYEH